MDTTPGLHLRSHLLAAGYTSAEVQRRRRARELVNVRRGAYVEPHDQRMRRADARHRLLVTSTVPRLATSAAISHASAAVLHGISVWNVPLDRVHTTRDASSGGRIGSVVHRHTAPLAPEDVVRIGGFLVTSGARTVLDLLRTVAFEQAVVIADSALRLRLVDPCALQNALDRAGRWPGTPAAERALTFADGRSGSVGESRSRVAIHRAGLPTPELQWTVVVDGRVVALCDFGWPALRTVGEFDGMVKYGELLRPGQTASDVVVAEKLREDAVRSTDAGVVRWIWPDLDDFDPVATRIRRTFRPR